MIFFSSLTYRITRRIRGRAVKALRSGRSQLCWRGFESHRMQHLFVFLLAPDYFLSGSWLDCLHQRLCRGGGGIKGWVTGGAHESTLVTASHPCQPKAHKKVSRQSLPRPKTTKKGYGGTGIRARVKRITTAYANHYTIPPRLGYRC